MGLDFRKYIKDKEQQEECEHTKKVASKYGISVVCDEDDSDEIHQSTLHLPDDEDCRHSKKVASKYGVQIVCDEEDEKNEKEK